MKKIFILALLVIFGALLYAQAEKTAPAKPKKLELHGEVVSVDATNQQIVIKDKEGIQHNFSLDPKAKIEKNGKEIELSSITPGEHVSVVYKKEGEKKVVTFLKVSHPVVKEVK